MDKDKLSSMQNEMQARQKLDGRRTTFQMFAFLLIMSFLCFGIYLYLFLADLGEIGRFGMTWAWISILVMFFLDISGSIFSMIGVRGDNIRDSIIDLGLVILCISTVLNLVVFLAIPSEDRYGEPTSWLPQEDYPHPCYNYRPYRKMISETDCNKLGGFAAAIWCTFIIFFIRILIITFSRYTVTYAKYGAPIYAIADIGYPSPYVVRPSPYVQYYPANPQSYYYYQDNPYCIQYPQQPQYIMVQQKRPSQPKSIPQTKTVNNVESSGAEDATQLNHNSPTADSIILSKS